MDPTTTLSDLLINLAALHDCPEEPSFRIDAAHQLQDLARWLRRGGFAPSVTEAMSALISERAE